MRNTCIVCGTEFEGRSGARYDKAACRKSASRGIVTDKLNVTNVTDNSQLDVTLNSTFTPNWKRLGLKNKEEARMRILATLAEAAKTSLATLGFEGEATWIINGRTVILTKTGFKEVK